MNTIQNEINELLVIIADIEADLENKQEELDNFDPSEYIDCDQYNDFLDGVYGDIEICGIGYAASIALKRVDPIAYRCGFNDYVDSIDLESIEEYINIQEEITNTEIELETRKEELQERLEFNN